MYVCTSWYTILIKIIYIYDIIIHHYILLLIQSFNLNPLYQRSYVTVCFVCSVFVLVCILFHNGPNDVNAISKQIMAACTLDVKLTTSLSSNLYYPAVVQSNLKGMRTLVYPQVNQAKVIPYLWDYLWAKEGIHIFLHKWSFLNIVWLLVFYLRLTFRITAI